MEEPAVNDAEERPFVEVTLCLPDGVSGDELREIVRKFARLLNEGHRSLGGSGLELLDLRIYKRKGDEETP